ncbi:MAG TPA: 50S ribosomal protein L21 [Ignavibacteriaceae bacterium]|jgi:large subunit ribosomal protein L21|nr:50S ribosomal protein L21 [Ignavibacteriaceae bacterium]
MFAVVDILGQQFKVEENKKYYVPKLKEETDTNVVFENVLLYSNDEGTKVGSPKVSGVKVVARVLQHLKDEKVLVFKKKRRTGYDKKNGHRQQLTRIEVTKIG